MPYKGKPLYKEPKKLNPYEITMPDFAQPAEHYEGMIVGSWKERKIKIPFLLDHEIRTLNGYKLNVVTTAYYFMPSYAQNHGRALSDILRGAIHEALIAAGWLKAEGAPDVDELWGYRAPMSFWPFFIDQEYRYHRI